MLRSAVEEFLTGLSYYRSESLWDSFDTLKIPKYFFNVTKLLYLVLGNK